jgi:hypothetical protein
MPCPCQVFLIRSPGWYFVRITQHEALRYQMFAYSSYYECSSTEKCEILGESRIKNGVQLWAVDKTWIETDKAHGRFCNKSVGLRDVQPVVLHERNEAGAGAGEKLWVWHPNIVSGLCVCMHTEDPFRRSYELQKVMWDTVAGQRRWNLSQRA